MKKIFETYLHQRKLGIPKTLHQELEQTALQLPKVDEVGVKWCKKNYPNGYTSYGSLSRLHEQFTVFDRLKQKLDQEVKVFCKTAGIKAPRGRIELSTLWVNLMPKNCYHAFHFHPNSVVSGTYYVRVNDETSPFRLEDPRAGLFMACPPRKIQEDVKAKAGEVLLFESWIKHEVPPHFSNETRISISFNYDWIQN